MDGVDLLINSLGGGGAERQVAHLGTLLSDARIITLEDAVRYETKAPIIVLSSVKPQDSGLIKALNTPLQLVRLIRITRNVPIISFLWRANVLNLLTALWSRHPVIISERQALVIGTPSMKRRFFLALLGVAYRQANAIVVNAQGTRDDLITWCGVDPERVHVIYNALDTTKIITQGNKPATVPARYVITSGRLDAQKGQDALLRAFAQVHQQDPTLELVILGAGPLEASLYTLTKNLELEKVVHFIGFHDNPFVWIARAEAFVLSSRFEGFPNVILEALALGAPVIATDCPHGPRELLAPDTDYRAHAQNVEKAQYGILVPAIDMQHRGVNEEITPAERALSEAIRAVTSDPDLQKHYRTMGPKRITAFSPPEIADEWRNVLAKLHP